MKTDKDKMEALYIISISKQNIFLYNFSTEINK